MYIYTELFYIHLKNKFQKKLKNKDALPDEKKIPSQLNSNLSKRLEETATMETYSAIQQWTFFQPNYNVWKVVKQF